jgi:hypothetical protein
MASKFITRTLAAATFAVAGMTMAPAAFATAVEALTPSPLGLTPTFLPNKAPGAAAFDYYFQFDVAAPYTNISANYNFNPAGSVTGFTGTVVSVSGCTGSPINDCTIGSVVGNFVSTSATELTLAGLNLAAGSYAYHFTGTSNSGSTGLSGQTSASVPAPAVLGLLAIGMMGVGATSRRRKA